MKTITTILEFPLIAGIFAVRVLLRCAHPDPRVWTVPEFEELHHNVRATFPQPDKDILRRLHRQSLSTRRRGSVVERPTLQSWASVRGDRRPKRVPQGRADLPPF